MDRCRSCWLLSSAAAGAAPLPAPALPGACPVVSRSPAAWPACSYLAKASGLPAAIGERPPRLSPPFFFFLFPFVVLARFLRFRLIFWEFIFYNYFVKKKKGKRNIKNGEKYVPEKHEKKGQQNTKFRSFIKSFSLKIKRDHVLLNVSPEPELEPEPEPTFPDRATVEKMQALTDVHRDAHFD